MIKQRKHKIFSQKIKQYSPSEIRFIRRKLGESRETFGRRFIVSFESVRNWETGRRNMQGPALRLMQLIEEEAGFINNDFNTAIRLSSPTES